MDISTSMEYGVSNGLTYFETARIMKAAGFDGIDLSLCHGQDNPESLLRAEWMEEALMMADAAKKAGLKISQCHLPYYPGHLPLPGNGSAEAFEEYFLKAYERALEACYRAGCTVAVMHMFWVENDDAATLTGNAVLIKKLVPLLDKYGINLALENVFCRRNRQYLTAFVSVKECIMQVIDAVNSPRVGACIDTGHANIFGMNISEMAQYFGDKLFALHVNSNAGHDEHAVPYSIAHWCEKLDFDEFTRTLKRVGFKGAYNLEITGGRFPKQVARPFYEYISGIARWLSDIE